MTARAPRRSRRTGSTSYAADAERYLEALPAATDPAARRALRGQHAALFDADAIGRLRQAARDADGDDDAARGRHLLAFALDGHLADATADIDAEIAEAERSAVVVWRGERLAYDELPARIAVLSERRERNGIDASFAEATDAINPLRADRLESMRAAYRALGWDSVLEAAPEAFGFDPTELAAILQEFFAASETVYYAALRRYLALIDIEQGDGTDADLRYLLRGAAWDHWFEARRAVPAISGTLQRLGFDQGPIDGSLPAGASAWADALEAAGRVAATSTIDPELPAADRLLGDPSVAAAYGVMLADLLVDPDWIGAHASLADQELPGWLDFAAFRRLHRLRREAATLLYELRLYREADPAVARAYSAGIIGLLTGVIRQEAEYLFPSIEPLASARAVRSGILAACLADVLRRRHGSSWWRVPEAGEVLRRAWRQGGAWDSEAVVAHLGYDRYDWRPVLRQIRTQLIGEMSGYGGPNITTRAGTRKV